MIKQWLQDRKLRKEVVAEFKSVNRDVYRPGDWHLDVSDIGEGPEVFFSVPVKEGATGKEALHHLIVMAMYVYLQEELSERIKSGPGAEPAGSVSSQ